MFDIPYTATVTYAKLPKLILPMLEKHFGVSFRIKAKHQQDSWLYLAVVNKDSSKEHSGLYVVHSNGSATKDKSLQFKVYREAECPVSGAKCPQSLLEATAAFRTDSAFARISTTYNESMALMRGQGSYGSVYLFHGAGYKHPSMDVNIAAWQKKEFVSFDRIRIIALDSIGDMFHLDCDETSIFQHGFSSLDPDLHTPVYENPGAGELITLGSMFFQSTACGLQVAGAAPTESQLKQYRRERMAAAHQVAAEKAVPIILFL
ncbi:hypothetical protein QAO71_17960 (plasmid) [Halopseudomonas sp. SMJS2]|uniref:hypothetical protein n=1 Tax=Halopseudomonas sp. SMJS2 TaxID=3041098 RepID=UPI00245322BB|nr:hypothetical protein [Halopseudomonas sp. SMJS2]WGK63428.1 hypothetical protein QAO71_17960 [Halopseudomonas sp. SMJS2]